MSRTDLQAFVQNLTEKLTSASSLSDGQLLQRWLLNRDEAAFELLVRRHGALVLGVCRRMLRDTRDVEDAFQAVFLTLLRKASTLRDHRVLSAWLYRVSYRICLRALKDRRTDTSPLNGYDVEGKPEMDETLWSDLRPVLDEEVNALPERYRRAFVLCHLEGRTNQEAADVLGCPLGTILSRLHWARQRLRSRLTRRGIAVSVAAITALSGPAVAAEVPGRLIETTLTNLLPVAGTMPVRVTSLSEGVLRTMFMSKLKRLAVAVAMIALLSIGTVTLLQQADAEQPARPQEKPKPPPVVKPSEPDDAPKGRDYILVPGQRIGVLAFVGRELKKGETVAEKDVREVVTSKGKIKIVRLREGDRVEKGQLLAHIDDELARAAIAVSEAKLVGMKAEVRAAEKTRDEAKIRYERSVKLHAQGAIAKEEVDGFKLTWERYNEEVAGKLAALDVAKLELERERIILALHDIRSPVDGVLQAILKREGEAVRELEAAFRIKPVEK